MGFQIIHRTAWGPVIVIEECRSIRAGDCHILLSGSWNDQYNYTIPSRQWPTGLGRVEEKWVEVLREELSWELTYPLWVYRFCGYGFRERLYRSSKYLKYTSLLFTRIILGRVDHPSHHISKSSNRLKNSKIENSRGPIKYRYRYVGWCLARDSELEKRGNSHLQNDTYRCWWRYNHEGASWRSKL